ncbi:hypothetical protein HPB47_010676 [Ixodes persulcatus]|uniref:Uncharacterized protein n=1 Tax=Ixodes persulcatus TaxID=34615 RepID=A0AC60NYG8_IXOPE|nr:hypothetical protein HPB47_010676 [Ixodes persulcatus]
MIRPIPKNMDPERHQERRQERAHMLSKRPEPTNCIYTDAVYFNHTQEVVGWDMGEYLKRPLSVHNELTRSSEIPSVMLRNIQAGLRDLRHRPSQNNASPKVDVPPNGMNSARPKARITALTGASETCKLIVVFPSTPRRSLFVTKLKSDTSRADISSHLSSVGVEKVEFRKLKTRYDS